MSLKKMLRDTDEDIISVEANEKGGFKMECKNKEDGTEWGGNYFGLVSYESLGNIEGKILTLIDATFSDKEQRKSTKDLFRRMFWFDWVENNIYQGKKQNHTEMPVYNLKDV